MTNSSKIQTVRRTALVLATAGAVIATTGAPVQAASHTVKRTATMRIGNPLSFHSSHWRLTTQSHGRGRNGGNYDRAGLCLIGQSRLDWATGPDPMRANFRIYAYNSRGRLVASRAGNNVRFGSWWGHGGWCKGLTVNRKRGAVRFLFRVNAANDGHGEKARSLSVKPR